MNLTTPGKKLVGPISAKMRVGMAHGFIPGGQGSYREAWRKETIDDRPPA